MKNLIIKLLVIIAVISCDDRELTEFSNFGFEIETITENDIFVFQKNNLSIEIIPVQSVENTIYNFEYSIKEGDGFIEYDGEKINEDELVSFQSLKNNLTVVSEKSESLVIEFKVSDNYGTSKDFLINYTVKEIPFEATLFPGKAKIFETESTSLRLNLGQKEISDVSYKFRLNDIADLADIEFPDGQIIKVDTWYDVEPGETIFNFVSKKPGVYNIELSIEDNFDQKLNINTSIEIMPVTFDFKVLSEETELFVTDQMNINLLATQNPDNLNLEYEVKLNTVEDFAELRRFTEDKWIKISPNTWEAFDIGNETLNLIGVKEGLYVIDMELRIKGQPERVVSAEKLEIQIKKTSYEFTADIVQDSFQLNTLAQINFILNRTGQEVFTYEMTYTSDTSGVFTYNGIAYPKDTPISIQEGNFSGFYKSDIEGEHNLRFTVKASNNTEKTSEIKINFVGYAFDIDKEDNSVALLNINYPIKFNIDAQFDDVYELYFEDDLEDCQFCGSTKLFYNTNEYLKGQKITSITNRSFEVDMRFNVIKKTKIMFFMKSQITNQIKSVEVLIDVKDKRVIVNNWFVNTLIEAKGPQSGGVKTVETIFSVESLASDSGDVLLRMERYRNEGCGETTFKLTNLETNEETTFKDDDAQIIIKEFINYKLTVFASNLFCQNGNPSIGAEDFRFYFTDGNGDSTQTITTLSVQYSD